MGPLREDIDPERSCKALLMAPTERCEGNGRIALPGLLIVSELGGRASRRPQIHTGGGFLGSLPRVLQDSVSLEPVGAVAEVHLEGDVELHGAFHAVAHQLGRGLQLCRGDLEDELVMDLEEQLPL